MNNHTRSSAEALLEAQKTDFASFVFQSAVPLKNKGTFILIFNNRHESDIATEAIETEKPLELKEFRLWNTTYENLLQLYSKQKQSRL